MSEESSPGSDHLAVKTTFHYRVAPPEDNKSDATAYWAHVDPYLAKVPWSQRIADAVAALRPSAVLEFGANAGRNLVAIRDRLPQAELTGLDINEDAVKEGKARWGLDLRVGDETAIKGFSVDVAFTVSVIDHLPEPLPAIKNLAAAAPRLILWEPWTGTEGRLVESCNSETGERREATPFSYSWDYLRLASEAGLKVLSVDNLPMETRLGPYYRMFHLAR